MDDVGSGLDQGAPQQREPLSEAELREAWDATLEADARDSQLSPSVARFADHADSNLAELHEQLKDGSWQPSTLSAVVIPKHDGSRELHIPSVRDRIIERAILHRLTPRLDPVLGSASFAFRPGLGVIDAVNAVVAFREEGLGWVVRADINDCFPTIDRDLVRTALTGQGVDPDLLPIIDALLERPVAHEKRTPRVPPVGIAQGGPLSPLLANLVLRTVDVTMQHEGWPIVRYADDMVVGAATQDDARTALGTLQRLLTGIGMTLNDDTAQVMSFDDGFAFLGEDLGPRYPYANPLFRIEARDRRSLYVCRPGCRVAIHAGRILVIDDDAEVLSVPSELVERIVLFGPVGLTAGARAWAASNDVDVTLCSQRGNYLGQLVSGSPKRVRRRMAQYARAADPQFRTEIARQIVITKLTAQASLLEVCNRPDSAETVASAIAQIEKYKAMVPACASNDEAMGLEGAGARSYFEAWRSLIPADITFGGRSRRPPHDVANAALSFGYTLQHGEVVGALVSSGLDPDLGNLHEPQDREFALGHDLIEEFRPFTVDYTVLKLLRNHSLTDAHGRIEGDGVFLTAAGREVLVNEYEHRMLRSASGAIPGFQSSYRRLLHLQCQRFAGVIEGRAESWGGLSWR